MPLPAISQELTANTAKGTETNNTLEARRSPMLGLLHALRRVYMWTE